MKNRKLKFNINTFTGEFYHIGFKLGKLWQKRDPFFKLLLHHLPIFPKITSESIQQMHRLLSEYDPGLLLEMMGFADATRISFAEVLIKLGGYGFQPKILSGCTQFAVLPGITNNNHLLVGRNYDFSPKKLYSDLQLTLIYPETGFNVLGMTQFVFGRMEGINNYSLYVGISVAHGQGRSDSGIFAPTIVRILLDKCKTAPEAIELIQKLPHSSTYNFLIADKFNAYAVEVSPPQISVRKPENGLIVVCNHYCAGELANEQKRIIPTTIERATTVKTIINQKVPLDFETIRKILSSHANLGVCLHHYQDFLGTIWSGIFDLTAGEVFYSLGSPCLNDYRKINFSNREILDFKFKGKIPEDELLN